MKASILADDIVCTDTMKQYFESLIDGMERCYEVARQARAKGYDPELEPEIPSLRGIAERVEGLLKIPGLASRVRELSQRYKDREELSINLAKEIVRETRFRTKEEAIYQAVRAGLAILTEGISVAPLEGVIKAKLKRNYDGSDYVALYFAGPIRSAGGTGQAMSVLIADVVRRELGVGMYKPTRGEIERFKEEIPMYKRVQHLQYLPTPEEIELIVGGCPVCIDGEGTEKAEVSGYRGLERVETDRVRGGACLVIAEGLILKAAKIKKHVSKLGTESMKDWRFIDNIISKHQVDEQVGRETIKDRYEAPEEDEKIAGDEKYMREILAGRPLIAGPSAKGGFRLRYGRSRVSGLAAAGIHPATMYVLDEFIAIGTQVKIELPGKASILTPCTTIDGPIVLLDSGDLVQLNSIQEAQALKSQIQTIVDVGEILISYGEFLENNYPLVEGAYSLEWWLTELKHKNLEFRTDSTIPSEFYDPTPELAFKLSEQYGIPLHPKFNLFWHDICIDDLNFLTEYIQRTGKYSDGTLTLPNNSRLKQILVDLGALHTVKDGKLIIDNRYSYVLLRACGLSTALQPYKYSSSSSPRMAEASGQDIMGEVSSRAGVTIMKRAPTRIGAKMGRPEKADARKLSPPIHVLFPLGLAGGSRRSIQDAAEGKGLPDISERKVDKVGFIDTRGEKPDTKLQLDIGMRKCSRCKRLTPFNICKCGGHTEAVELPRPAGKLEALVTVDIGKLLADAKAKLNEHELPNIKGVKGLVSKSKTPEPLEKGILRAKHGVFVFKDGTIRYDMTDAPLTHFRPREIGTSVEQLKALGYTHDYRGAPLEHEDQIVELKVQDLVPSRSCGEYLLRAAKFIDELLVKFYGLPPFYCAERPEDLVGHLTIGLSPHTSGGVLTRIIGYTDARVGFAHPYYHAAKRRNCIRGTEGLFLYDGNEWKYDTLGNIVDELITNGRPICDDFGTETVETEGYYTFSLNPHTKKFELTKIKAFSRHIGPEHVMIIKTKSGRTITATGDHPFPLFNGHNFDAKNTHEVNEILTPIRVEIQCKDVEKIDLLNLGIKDVMVRDISDTVRRSVGLFKNKSRELMINYKTFMDYIYRDSFPLDLLNKMHVSVPKDVAVSVKRDTVKLPRFIKVDEDFTFLLGFYLAEGYCRKAVKGHYQVCFTACTDEIKNLICKKVERVFNIKPSIQGNAIVLSSKLIYSLFIDYLKIGHNAKTKQIPSMVFSLPESKIIPFISGYFSGDGSISKGSTIEVTCTSVNKPLLAQLGFLLHRLGIPYSCTSSDREVSSKIITDFYGKPKHLRSYKLRIYGEYAKMFINKIGFAGSKHTRAIRLVKHWEATARKSRLRIIGDCYIDKVITKNFIKNNDRFVYSLTLEPHHNFVCSEIVVKNCDGDEDCQILLLDGLINFSRSYLPSSRGGLMDAPLIISTQLNPNEIDKEAHNVDVTNEYPLEFYEATLRHAHPREIKGYMDIIESRIGSERQYENFGFTHDTADINEGVKITFYKILGDMMQKLDAQLALATKLRSVNVAEVAGKVIETHLLPDMIGNLRAYSTQTVRCTKCNMKYRRIPLGGVCKRRIFPGNSICGGNLILTVHEGNITKYLDKSKELAEKYNISPYMYQRVLLVEQSVNSLIQNDKIKKCRLEDFL